jgi:hypothetical protein
VSSLQEIELAIASLSSEGDLVWQRIVRDPTPSPSLSNLVDAVDAEYRRNPEAFPEIKQTDFERHS